MRRTEPDVRVAYAVDRSRYDAKGVLSYQPGATPRVHSRSFVCRLKACFISFCNNKSKTTAMPQSLSQVIVHIVFSTKDRTPLLDTAIRRRMHAYLATVCRDCDCEAYRVGGVADHVHVAARLARTVSQADLLEKIKKTSSAWVKTQGREYQSFFWQTGTVLFLLGTANSTI